MKKYLVLAALAVMVAALALVGCSSGGSSASASASGSSASASASSEAASSSAAAEIKLVNEGTLTFATSPDFPPFESDEGGEFVGYEIELAKALGDKLGLEVKFEVTDFDSIFTAVAAGTKVDAGISGISIKPEREEIVDFTTSYVEDNQSVAVMKDSGITKENAAEELNKEGVVIAVQAGTTGADYAAETFPKAKIVEYKSNNDSFADMQAGNVTAVCTNLAVVERMLAGTYSDAEIVYQDATAEPYAIVVSKDNPALTEALNKALEELQADGTIDKIFSE